VSGKLLVAGVGNIFLVDDGFGVEVARRLAAESWPPGVEVADFGIRGVHLAYHLLDGYDLLVLVDALSQGEEPGTVFLLEPDVDSEPGREVPITDAHGLDPESVLAIVRTLGGKIGRVLVVGCEPAELVERIGLSAVVERAVEEAIRMVRDIIRNWSSGEHGLEAESRREGTRKTEARTR